MRNVLETQTLSDLNVDWNFNPAGVLFAVFISQKHSLRVIKWLSAWKLCDDMPLLHL